MYFKWSSALIVGFFFFMKSNRNLFSSEIDFCKPGVIQGFDLNFNLYLLIFLKGAKLSNNSLILFKNISVEYFLYFQHFIPINRKIIKNKIFLIKVRPVSLINIGLVGRGLENMLGTIRHWGRWLEIVDRLEIGDRR